MAMENQHRKIEGYRELNEEEIALMNMIKSTGKSIQVIISQLQDTKDIDQRWVSIGQTELQKGLMALTRAVAKPTTF
jgi:hypothetical protein